MIAILKIIANKLFLIYASTLLNYDRYIMHKTNLSNELDIKRGMRRLQDCEQIVIALGLFRIIESLYDINSQKWHMFGCKYGRVGQVELA
jgi:hypothetical protein